MNKYVINQLQKCKVACIPEYDSSTRHLIIPKATTTKQLMQVGKCFLIRISDQVMHNPNNIISHDNWNNGKAPVRPYMKVEINKVMGDMVKVLGIGYDHISNIDTNEIWEGWLPIHQIQIINSI